MTARATTTPREAAAGAWGALGLDPADLAHLRIDGTDPVFPSDFAVGTAAAASAGVAGLAAVRLGRERGGAWSEASVDVRHAAIAVRSERALRVDGHLPPSPWDPTAGYYRDRDGRAIQLHTNFPHHRERALRVLDAAPERDAVAAAVARWDAFALEEALAGAGACGYALRSPAEWRAHPQGAAVRALPLLTVASHAGAPPEPLPPAPPDAPLAGVRVLDLTRVIAGPVCGRTLAALGADVLRVGAARLPVIATLVADTGVGKRFAHVDLDAPGGREQLAALVREADVVVSGYRPGALAARGLGFEEIARLRPGIVHVALCAWSESGPWAARRGYDSLVQTASGIAHEGGQRAGRPGDPVPLPAQALDHATGYLAAAAAIAGLVRRSTAGGTTEVRLSLAQTGAWIDGLGRVDGSAGAEPADGEVAARMVTMPSAWGEIAVVRSPIAIDGTPATWGRPPSMPGADPPAWLPRDDAASPGSRPAPRPAP